MTIDEKYYEQIKKAAEDSLKNPGGVETELPKDKINLGDNYIVIFRHGESQYNKLKIFTGWLDPDLTERGIEQAKALSDKLKVLKLDVVITSDLIRSINTAKYALSDFPGIKWESDVRIRERNYGDLNGRSKEEAMIMNPTKAVLWRRGYDTPPPGGESLKMVEERVFPFLEELIKRIKSEKINVALSMHGNSMRVTRKYFEKMDIITELTHENPLGSDYALYKAVSN